MLAVLLAEAGGRLTALPRLPHLTLAATVLGLAIGVAAFAGAALAPTMNANARALMLGIALVLTGCGQFGRAFDGTVPGSLRDTLLLVWRSGAPFLAFAFAVWRAAPSSAAAGALAGVAASAAIGSAMGKSPLTVRLRRAGGALLIVAGFYAAVWALRLV